MLLGDDGIFVRRAASSGFVAEATYPGLRLAPQPDLLTRARLSHDSAKRRIPLGTSGAYPLRAIYLLDEPASAAESDRAEAALLPPREGSSRS
jgi:hypothetical protein